MIELPITSKYGKGEKVIIDDMDADLLYTTWCISPSGYVYTKKFNKSVYLHRIILSRKLGRQLNGRKETTDHINGNKCDNRRENIRLATNTQNNWNTRPKKNGRSKYKGVCWHEGKQSWMVFIRNGVKRIYLGIFKKEDEIKAAKCYDRAAKEFHGEFAYLNFPDE